MKGNIDLRYAILLSLKDGRWRTSSDIAEHPAMRRHAVTPQQVGTNLNVLLRMGLVRRQVDSGGGSTRMWQTALD